MYPYSGELLLFRQWLYSKVKKVDPRILQSITCVDPNENKSKMCEQSVWIGPDVEMEKGVKIYPNVQVRGKSKIGRNTVLESGTTISDSVIYADCIIGPTALIEHSEIGEGSHIGFTAQIKRSKLGPKINAKHHCYVGDTIAPEGEVNLSAGSITGNYDGVQKHMTEIGQGVFIGCNVVLIAPRKIGHDVYIGAGALVKEDIEPNTLIVPITQLHNSTSILPHKTNRGYQLVKIDKRRMKGLREFLGEEIGEWLFTPHTVFGNKTPVELLQTGSVEDGRKFDSGFESLKASCCT